MSNEYSLTISRLTIDKLGVKLYDRVAAVIAELVSNSYDADATEVLIEAPMGEYLASKAGGTITDKGYTIKITDNGIGMTPQEANDYYLKVGAERREDGRPGRGSTSRKFERKVMGRKGVGKLAPFGICEIIEIITSGGEKVSQDDSDGNEVSGYQTAHFIMDRNEILKDTDETYTLANGCFDGTLRPKSGTTVILRKFAFRKVPDHKVFVRQLAQRFGIAGPSWEITTHDTESGYEESVGEFHIEQMEQSAIKFQGERGPKIKGENGDQFPAIGPASKEIEHFRAGFEHDGYFYPIEGWVAYSKVPYRDDLMSGIRIYCKGKIAAQSAVFNLPAGFHGEHSIRSYLIGAIHADWLDDDDDLIQTDRRDILWSHELGEKLQEWGQLVVRQMGNIARDPMRTTVWQRFLEVGQVEDRINSAFPGSNGQDLRGKALYLARTLGRTLRGDEVEDQGVVHDMVQLIITLAPLVSLDDALRQAADETNTISVLADILKAARLAEISSFGRIASDRVKVIQKLKQLKMEDDTDERSLQYLIENAPWLINPQWSPIAANQTLRSLKNALEEHCEVELRGFSQPMRRPDFVLSSQGKMVQVVEIKKPQHKLTDDEMKRITVYRNEINAFLNDPANSRLRQYYDSFHITLVCDGIALSDLTQDTYDLYEIRGELTRINWTTFLAETELVHQDFLNEDSNENNSLS